MIISSPLTYRMIKTWKRRWKWAHGRGIGWSVPYHCGFLLSLLGRICTRNRFNDYTHLTHSIMWFAKSLASKHLTLDVTSIPTSFSCSSRSYFSLGTPSRPNILFFALHAICACSIGKLGCQTLHSGLQGTPGSAPVQRVPHVRWAHLDVVL